MLINNKRKIPAHLKFGCKKYKSTFIIKIFIRMNSLIDLRQIIRSYYVWAMRSTFISKAATFVYKYFHWMYCQDGNSIRVNNNNNCHKRWVNQTICSISFGKEHWYFFMEKTMNSPPMKNNSSPAIHSKWKKKKLQQNMVNGVNYCVCYNCTDKATFGGQSFRYVNLLPFGLNPILE